MGDPNKIFMRFASAIAVVAFVPAFSLDTAVNLIAQVSGGAAVSAANSSAPADSKGASPAVARISSSYGKLPISFEVNQGQTDKTVQFLARGTGYTLFLTPGEAVLSLHASNAEPRKPGEVAVQSALPPSTVRLQLIGSNIKAEAAGVDPLPGKTNYFVGNDPAKWHTNVPTFARVRYSGIYPGIDLVYYGNQEGRLEHDFVVAPGANPDAIAMDFGGRAGSLHANPDGDLILQTKAGDLSVQRPAVYQMINGRKKTIEAAYTLNSDNKVAFRLGDYDKRVPLIIDPVIQYSAAFGGSNYDVVVGIAVDKSGEVYVTGRTLSLDFPLANPFQDSWTGTGFSAFVSKLNTAGTALVYSTYLAGSPTEQDNYGTDPRGIAVDSAGRAYVFGIAGPGQPLKNPYQSTLENTLGSFLTVFNPAGDDLVYSTYVNNTFPVAIAVDASSNAYITGGPGVGFSTLHSILPQPSGNCLFASKFNNVGVLQYASIFACVPEQTQVFAIAVDSSGSAYLTGTTFSSTYPVTKNAFQPKCLSCNAKNSNNSGFVTKLNPSGNSYGYSTYLGGTNTSAGNDPFAIAVDTSGNAYVAGYAVSGFPVTANAFQKTNHGGEDGFITKLNSSGTGLIYSTYLGGFAEDQILGLALDQYRQVYVYGPTGSTNNFPVKAPLQSTIGPAFFVTTLSATGSSIVYYSTTFGDFRAGAAGVGGIAVDSALNVYLAGGITKHNEVPVTPGALNKRGMYLDVFVSKLVIMDDLSIAVSASPSPVRHGGNLTYTIATTSKGPDFAVNLRVDDVLPQNTTFVSANAGGGTCTTPAVGGTGELHCVLPQQEKGQTYTITLTVQASPDLIPGSHIINTATVVSNTQDFVPGNNTGTITTQVN